MNYTIKQFKEKFFDNDACLDYIFKARFGRDFICPKCGKAGFYRIKSRKCYGCAWCGYQIYPLKGTIFSGSSTDLYNWFFILYLVSTTKHGLSAKEIQRHLGTTYKTAWRIGKLIRSLMEQEKTKLDKQVEIDEFYYGGKRTQAKVRENKSMIMGMIKRGGKMKAKYIEDFWTPEVLKAIAENVERGTYLMTDDSSIYRKVDRLAYFRGFVKHKKKEFVKGEVHTNTIECAWKHLKKNLNSTYNSVNPKYLQSYINEFVFQYNHRFSSSVSVFEALLLRLCELHYQEGQKISLGVPVSS